MQAWSLELGPNDRWLVLLPSVGVAGWMPTAFVSGPTRSEVRAQAKARLGLSRKARLPIGTYITKLGK